jgi:hypothetical protein
VRFGRTFEEFEVGAVLQALARQDGHRALFCLLTMNHRPPHLDANYTERATGFGRNVVVGASVYSVLLGGSVANLEVESLRHVAPTFHSTATPCTARRPSLPRHRHGPGPTGESCRSSPGGTTRSARWSPCSPGRVLVPTAAHVEVLGGEPAWQAAAAGGGLAWPAPRDRRAQRRAARGPAHRGASGPHHSRHDRQNATQGRRHHRVDHGRPARSGRPRAQRGLGRGFYQMMDGVQFGRATVAARGCGAALRACELGIS